MNYVLYLLIPALLSFPAMAGESSQQSIVANSKNCVESLEADFLADRDILISQEVLNPFIAKDGGGACASATAIVALQAARKLCGLNPLENPHQAFIESVGADNKILLGRLTNTRFCELISFYSRYLDGATMKAESVSARNSPFANSDNFWLDALSHLQAREDEIKVLSFSVTTADGVFQGRHFVVLKTLENNSITVVDPNHLGKKRSYLVQVDSERDNRVLLVPTKGAAGHTFELNTIFTIKVLRTATHLMSPTETTALETIVEKVEGLARKLREEGKLRSPVEWRRESSKFGLPSLDLPSEFGGANWPASRMVEVFRIAGVHDLNLRDVVGAAHGRVLLASGSPPIRDVIQEVADGHAYIAIAITEPTSGSNFTAMESTCTRVPGGYLLNGVKRFNARLEQASHVITFTRANPESSGLNAFLIPLPSDGVEVESFGAHGLIGNSYGGLKLDNAFVPSSFRIGEEGDGTKLFFDHFRYWRLMQTAAAIGTAEGALEQLEGRLLTRNVNGAPIGRFTHLQQPLGQYDTQLKMAFSLTKDAACLLDQGRFHEADPLICGLKAEGVEIALSAVDSAMRAFGGEGYSDRVDLGDRFRDLMGLRIADGTTDVMRSAVVRYRNQELWDLAIEGVR